MIINVAATYAHPLLNVVHAKKPWLSKTGTVNMDPGQIPTKIIVKASPAT